MVDNLRQRYDALNAKAEKLSEHVQARIASPAAAFGVSALLVEVLELARDAIERLEKNTAMAVVPFAVVHAAKHSQKPLECQGMTLGEVGKIDTQECKIPIPAGPIDIREFTCRRV